MPDRASRDPHGSYGDVLSSAEDLQLLRLVRDLIASYAVDPPRELQAWRLRKRSHAGPAKRDSGRSRRRGRTTALLAGVALCTLVAGVVLAAEAITNLGKQTNALSPHDRYPLGAFRKYDKPLRSHSRYEFLFIASGWNYDLVETWPVVKALDQFGTFSGVRAVDRVCSPPSNPPPQTCTFPGFDLSQARYHSPNISFVYHQLLDQTRSKCPMHPTAYEARLLRRFHVRYGIPPGLKIKCWWIPNVDPEANPLPLVLVGGYVQANLDIINVADFSTFPNSTDPSYRPPPVGLPFATIQSDLQKGTDPPNTTLNEDVDAEANVITTLICHADGGKPKSVCSRPAIREMMKYVK